MCHMDHAMRKRVFGHLGRGVDGVVDGRGGGGNFLYMA